MSLYDALRDDVRRMDFCSDSTVKVTTDQVDEVIDDMPRRELIARIDGLLESEVHRIMLHTMGVSKDILEYCSDDDLKGMLRDRMEALDA